MEEDKKQVEKEEKKGSTISKEEMEAISRDIQSTKESLVTKESQDAEAKAKAAGKEEAQKEFELQQKLKEQEEANKKLQEELEKTKTETAEKLNIVQKKVDEMIGSKASVESKNPFETAVGLSKEVDNWSDDKVNEIENRSARKFFGADYDDR